MRQINNAISFSKLVVTSYEIKGYPELARRHTLEEPQRKATQGRECGAGVGPQRHRSIKGEELGGDTGHNGEVKWVWDENKASPFLIPPPE